MNSSFPKYRIAPTPSGLLHIGNGVSFALTSLLARQHDATLLLRIDDLDRARFRQQYLKDIFTTLRWMGIEWQEGPTDPKNFIERHSQHHRLRRYREVLNQLTGTKLVYACSCSRREIRARSTDGNYPGTCRHRNLPLDTPGVAWRLRVEENTIVRGYQLASLLGDVVIRKKDGFPAYQLGSVVDDFDYRITHVVRGIDLLPSTLFQIYLAQLLSYQRFDTIQFVHHPLIVDEGGDKLSKSTGAEALARWRETGRGPQELFDRAEQWLASQYNVVL